MHTGRMSRMRTSFASLLWARPAMRRACSSGVRAGSGPFFAASLAAVEAEPRDLGGHGPRHQVVDRLTPRDPVAHLAGRDRYGLELEEADALRVLEPLEHAIEPLARIARTGGDGDRRELKDAVRVLPVEEVAELVGADQEHGVAEAAVGAVDAVGRAAVGARPVDEVVGELGGRGTGGLLGGDELEERAPELLDAGSGRTRKGEDAQDPRILDGELGHLRHEVDLVQDDDLWPLLEAGAVLGQLVVDRAELALWLPGGYVDHVHEQARALEVREELVAETDAFARALDQAAPVGAVLLPATSRTAVAGLEPLLPREAGKVAPVGIGHDDHVAAPAAVAAVGPTLRDVLLAPEAQPAVAAAAGLDANLGSIMEHSRGPRADVRPATSPSGLVDVYEAALAAPPELHAAVAQREDRVVAAEARPRAGAEPRAALAHDDRPGAHLLAGEDLHAEHLRVRVAPVARRAETLLMRHLSPPSSWPPASAPAPSASASRPPSASPPRPSSAPPSSRRSTRSRSATGSRESRYAAGSH